MFFCVALLLIGCWSCLGAEVTVTIEPCPPGWTEYEGFCYRYFSNIMSWNNAQDFCENVGSNGYSTGANYQRSNLVSIHSAAEQDFIYDYWVTCRDSIETDKKTLNIGLNDPRRNRVWEWSDGSEVDYLNWAPGEPNNLNNYGEYYGNMYNNKKWNDEHVGEIKNCPFICKMPRAYNCGSN